MGGGVWRIKQLHRNRNRNGTQICDQNDESETFGDQLLAVAAMHSGFHIVDTSKAEIVASYTEEHKSLAYGIDIRDECCRLTQNEVSQKDIKNLWLASCSFYDHTLKLWNVNF